MPMVIAFTGSHRGITATQRDHLREYLSKHEQDVLVQGCCLGADADAAHIANTLGIRIVGYPSNLKLWTSQTAINLCGSVALPEPPLIRNKRMVTVAAELVACPAEDHEVLRSGTWATIRYARKAGIPVTIFYPDGTYDAEA